jgi:hypothetical protein
MAPRLEFRRLVLTSPGRNYEVEFHDGVNVIAGPFLTGKSSILELLDFICGAREAPAYPELAKCFEVLAEICAGGETLTIRRLLRGSTGRATVYEGSLDEVQAGNVRGVDVSARHAVEERSVSLEVLERLGLGSYKVKTAPTKDASEVSSFSLRDLLFLVYVDQDRMGSRTSFFENEHFKQNKWRAAFEIAHGLFDANLAAMADALRVAQQQEQEVRRYLEHARRFLDHFKVPPLHELEAEAQTVTAEIVRAREGQRELRANERARLGEHSQLADRRNKTADEERELAARADELRRNARQLGRLRVQYERELAQWLFLEESQVIMGSVPVSRCPACFQGVSLVQNPEHCHVCKQELEKTESGISVQRRLRAATRRVSDLDAYLNDLALTTARLEAQRDEKVRAIREMLRRVRGSSVLPETRAIVAGNELVAELEQRHSRLRERIEYRKRAQGEGSTLEALSQRVAELQEANSLAINSKRSASAVVQDLTAWFQALLADISFPTTTNSYVDLSSYRPFVRGQPYPELSSKGAISLVVVAWHLALMEDALKEGTRSRFPRLLMLDSPLSHVGRDATDPEFRDQKLVDGVYAVLARLHRRASEFQIFIVDNSPPPSAVGMVAIKFTGDPSSGRYGLIDDEHPLVAGQPADE